MIKIKLLILKKRNHKKKLFIINIFILFINIIKWAFIAIQKLGKKIKNY